MKSKLYFLAWTSLMSVLLTGCGSPATTDVASSTPSTTASTPAAGQETGSAPTAAVAPSTGTDSAASAKPSDSVATGTKSLEKEQVVVLHTNLGDISIKMRSDVAPGTVKNFVKLVTDKFYDGTRFHRVIPGFMIQGGDPKSKESDRSVMGTGDPGYKIKAEFNDLSHKRGVVSMARSSDPDSAGSQFFIVVKDSTFLDHQYTAFGEVTAGMDVVDKIVALKRDGKDNPVEENPAIIKTATLQSH